MDIRDAIQLLESTAKNSNVKITKIDYYEGTEFYKNKVLNGEIQICIKYEENKDE